ncbi:hypothetical protein PsYK624_127700 [Phanerochaete sordida]|uniref:UDENN domain-containing protein n=1 Tax=Phanerochaete sordida TaxID=48140 RepID=A0A9P3GJY8_9APHY|nr:hypothetical protein PsYK624_127700 [Phanerochaete sordida]
MAEEEDIGLYNLARRSDSSTETHRKRNPRRPSIVTVVHGEERTPIKSPSNPSLVPPSPKVNTRKLSRSNTLPKLSRADSSGGSTGEDFQNLAMQPSKVQELRRWILSLAIVDFDLDYGPKITSVYPSLELTDAETTNLAFASFPDSPQTASGSYIHSFRIRLPQSLAHSQNVRDHSAQDGFVYGFSHFTQRRDSTSKRGYQQRSLVILSQHPYPSLFYTILSYLGQSFLVHGAPMLEVACHNIANWSDPHPGSIVELGFLGYVFTAELPTSPDAQQSSNAARAVEKYDPDSHILVSLSPQDPPIIDAFEASISHIWSIWECLLLGEPILVYGPSAAVTSQIVWWLRDLLRPIPLGGDFRPFFTIHDVDHGSLVNPKPPQSGLLLGVTNPFFEKTCNHWPHILSLSASSSKGKSSARQSFELSVGPAPGWTTKTHKRYISKDKALLKRLEDAAYGDEHARLEASEALRQHLTSRTMAFLVPLQRYLNTLIPTFADRTAPSTPNLSTTNFASTTPRSAIPSNVKSAFNQLTVAVTPSTAAPLRLKPFSEAAFLASLKANGSPLPFKSGAKRKEFYERWLRTRSFGLWLTSQEEVVDKVLATPFPSGVSGRSSAGS